MTELMQISEIDPEAYLDALREGNFTIDQLRTIQKANFKHMVLCQKGADNCERIAQGVGDIINARMMGGEITMAEETPQENAPDSPESPEVDPKPAENPAEPAADADSEESLDKSDEDR